MPPLKHETTLDNYGDIIRVITYPHLPALYIEFEDASSEVSMLFDDTQAVEDLLALITAAAAQVFPERPVEEPATDDTPDH